MTNTNSVQMNTSNLEHGNEFALIQLPLKINENNQRIKSWAK